MLEKLKRIFYYNENYSKVSIRQKGQGTVEYILILVVSIALVTALAAVYAKPMRNFITAYLGGYYKCLLQTGELPKLGTDQDASNSSGDCNAILMQAISGGGGGGAGGPGGAGSLGKNGKNGNGKNGNNGDGTDKNGSGGDGSGGEGEGSGNAYGANGGSSGGTRVLSKRIKRAGQASPVGVTEAAEGRVRDLGRAQDGKFFKGGNNGETVIYITRRNNKIPVNGNLISEMDKRKLKKAESNIRTMASVEQDFKSGKKKFVIKEKARTETEIEAKVSFSISNIFRILLIIVIIGAIVLFVGGQAMQISKSWEK